MLTLTGAAMSRGKCDTIERNAEFAERVVDSHAPGPHPPLTPGAG